MIDASHILLQALADPVRRGMFQRLAEAGEMNVRALTEGAGVSQPAVSRHLGVMKRAGLVADRQSGRETFYRASPEGLRPLVDWVAHYGGFWDEKFARLENLLGRMDR